MLKMDCVSFGYKNKRRKVDTLVIENLTLEFTPGKVYSIYGDSGLGKSTCLALLGGLEQPLSGRILLDGVDIKDIGYNRLRRDFVSFIFQDYHLFSYMNAIENTIMSLSSKRTVELCNIERAKTILTSLGLDERDQNRPISKLSGGQKQRVAIARALITDSTYILADEPTGNLDKENTINILEILQHLAHNEKKCVIIVTHSERVKKMSDCCIPLYR